MRVLVPPKKCGLVTTLLKILKFDIVCYTTFYCSVTTLQRGVINALKMKKLKIFFSNFHSVFTLKTCHPHKIANYKTVNINSE